nr:NUDIX domain-containing protein [Kineosporia babensis]
MVRVRAAAGVVVRNEDGHVLVLHPTYKTEAELPGGSLEADESPLQACRREPEEELGFVPPVAGLLCVDWVPPRIMNVWARQEWHIENRLHWVRDMTLREDEQRARTGRGPAVFAVLRNTAIGYHRTEGEPNIARATRRASRRPEALIQALTSSGATTQ